MSFDPLTGSFTEFHPVHSLFKRCVSCDGSVPPCPKCASDEICTMVSQNCDHCATTKCIANPNAKSSSSSGPNTGAIAGGVVGGIVGLAAILFLVYWFVIRPRRAERAAQQEKNNRFGASRSDRQSVGGQSIASTVLTRASNVIQIAYIPGVTNRSPPDTPHSLVPPVPPLPGAHPDQHFFMPGDLRDSSWTTTTGGGHQSISPTLRSSVATTIYRNDAIVSAMPAQSVSRARANVVSVHSGPGSGATTPTSTHAPVLITPVDAPAVPAITSSQLAKAEALSPTPSAGNNGSSIVARTVMAKPVMVRGASLKKTNKGPDASKKINPSDSLSTGTTAVEGSNHSSQQFSHNTSTFDGSSSEDEGDDEEIEAVIQQAQPSQVQAAPHQPRESQLSKSKFGSSKLVELPDTSSSATLNPPSGTNSKRSSATDKTTTRVESPFSDANELP